MKWDRYAGTDILPFWVADMDFASPPEVVDALQARLDHGVFGYTVPYDEAADEDVASDLAPHRETLAEHRGAIRDEVAPWVLGYADPVRSRRDETKPES